jgi:probable O-glycosylation ligase (exosortase A-associated)
MLKSLLVATLVGLGILATFRWPYMGAIMWAWISYMNPHRLTYGFAYDAPFAMIIAAVTLLMFVVTKDKMKFPVNSLTILWLLLNLAFCISSISPLNPDFFWEFERTMKIQLMAFISMLLITDRQKLNHFIWIIVLSLGFFGVKGGAFAVATGGSFRVWGPPDTFVEGNNELALALLMILPLMRYLQTTLDKIWQRHVMTGAMVLVLFAVIASHSRGAFASLCLLVFIFIMKSDKKVPLTIGVLVLAGTFAAFVPKNWTDRMNTIESAEKDESFMGRVHAWEVATNIALDRPLVGGGFDMFIQPIYWRYNRNPDAEFHDVHSIYFEMLGEHGFPGLIIFVSLFIAGWFFASGIIRDVRHRPDLAWAGRLAAMIQVGLTAYGSGGALLGLAYYDLPYSMLSMLVITRYIIDSQLKQGPPFAEGATPIEPVGEIAPRYGMTLGELRRRKSSGA